MFQQQQQQPVTQPSSGSIDLQDDWTEQHQQQEQIAPDFPLPAAKHALMQRQPHTVGQWHTSNPTRQGQLLLTKAAVGPPLDAQSQLIGSGTAISPAVAQAPAAAAAGSGHIHNRLQQQQLEQSPYTGSHNPNYTPMVPVTRTPAVAAAAAAGGRTPGDLQQLHFSSPGVTPLHFGSSMRIPGPQAAAAAAVQRAAVAAGRCLGTPETPAGLHLIGRSRAEANKGRADREGDAVHGGSGGNGSGGPSVGRLAACTYGNQHHHHQQQQQGQDLHAYHEKQQSTEEQEAQQQQHRGDEEGEVGIGVGVVEDSTQITHVPDSFVLDSSEHSRLHAAIVPGDPQLPRGSLQTPAKPLLAVPRDTAAAAASGGAQGLWQHQHQQQEDLSVEQHMQQQQGQCCGQGEGYSGHHSSPGDGVDEVQRHQGVQVVPPTPPEPPRPQEGGLREHEGEEKDAQKQQQQQGQGARQQQWQSQQQQQDAEEEQQGYHVQQLKQQEDHGPQQKHWQQQQQEEEEEHGPQQKRWQQQQQQEEEEEEQGYRVQQLKQQEEHGPQQKQWQQQQQEEEEEEQGYRVQQLKQQEQEQGPQQQQWQHQKHEEEQGYLLQQQQQEEEGERLVEERSRGLLRQQGVQLCRQLGDEQAGEQGNQELDALFGSCIPASPLFHQQQQQQHQQQKGSYHEQQQQQQCQEEQQQRHSKGSMVSVIEATQLPSSCDVGTGDWASPAYNATTAAAAAVGSGSGVGAGLAAAAAAGSSSGAGVGIAAAAGISCGATAAAITGDGSRGTHGAACVAGSVSGADVRAGHGVALNIAGKHTIATCKQQEQQTRECSGAATGAVLGGGIRLSAQLQEEEAASQGVDGYLRWGDGQSPRAVVPAFTGTAAVVCDGSAAANHVAATPESHAGEAAGARRAAATSSPTAASEMVVAHLGLLTAVSVSVAAATARGPGCGMDAGCQAPEAPAPQAAAKAVLAGFATPARSIAAPKTLRAGTSAAAAAGPGGISNDRGCVAATPLRLAAASTSEGATPAVATGGTPAAMAAAAAAEGPAAAAAKDPAATAAVAATAEPLAAAAAAAAAKDPAATAAGLEGALTAEAPAGTGAVAAASEPPAAAAAARAMPAMELPRTSAAAAAGVEGSTYDQLQLHLDAPVLRILLSSYLGVMLLAARGRESSSGMGGKGSVPLQLLLFSHGNQSAADTLRNTLLLQQQPQQHQRQQKKKLEGLEQEQNKGWMAAPAGATSGQAAAAGTAAREPKAAGAAAGGTDRGGGHGIRADITSTSCVKASQLSFFDSIAVQLQGGCVEQPVQQLLQHGVVMLPDALLQAAPPVVGASAAAAGRSPAPPPSAAAGMFAATVTAAAAGRRCDVHVQGPGQGTVTSSSRGSSSAGQASGTFLAIAGTLQESGSSSSIRLTGRDCGSVQAEGHKSSPASAAGFCNGAGAFTGVQGARLTGGRLSCSPRVMPGVLRGSAAGADGSAAAVASVGKCVNIYLARPRAVPLAVDCEEQQQAVGEEGLDRSRHSREKVRDVEGPQQHHHQQQQQQHQQLQRLEVEALPQEEQMLHHVQCLPVSHAVHSLAVAPLPHQYLAAGGEAGHAWLWQLQRVSPKSFIEGKHQQQPGQGYLDRNVSPAAAAALRNEGLGVGGRGGGTVAKGNMSGIGDGRDRGDQGCWISKRAHVGGLHFGKRRRISAAGAARAGVGAGASGHAPAGAAVATEAAAGARTKQGVTPDVGGSARGATHSSRSLGLRPGKHLGLKPQPRKLLNQTDTAAGAAAPTTAAAVATALHSSSTEHLASRMASSSNNAGVAGEMPVVPRSVIDLPAATYKGIPFPALSSLCFVEGPSSTATGAGIISKQQQQQGQGVQQQQGLLPEQGDLLLVACCQEGLVAVWDVGRRQLLTSAYPFTGALQSLLPLAPPAAAGSGKGVTAAGGGGWGPVVLLAQVKNEEQSRSGRRAPIAGAAATADLNAANSGHSNKQQEGEGVQSPGSSLVPLLLHPEGAVIGAAYPLPGPVVSAAVAGGGSEGGGSGRKVAALLQNGEVCLWDAYSGAVDMRVHLAHNGVNDAGARGRAIRGALGLAQGLVGLAVLEQEGVVVVGDGQGCSFVSC